MDSSNFKVVCDHCDAKLASVFCHSDGAFLCPQCDAQVHSVNKLAQRHPRVPCQSCPIWAYREAKSRGRLLDMPLAACLTRNLQLDIFDGTNTCWPCNNIGTGALATPQSDSSSPQHPMPSQPAGAGSPTSPVPANAPLPTSSSWPQNSTLSCALGTSLPQSVPQPSACGLPTSPCADTVEVLRATQLGVSPYSTCSGTLQAAATAGVMPEPCAPQLPTTAPVAAAGDGQSPRSLQRAESQEVMAAVDSMDMALLLDTSGSQLGSKHPDATPAEQNTHNMQQQQEMEAALRQQQMLVVQQQQLMGCAMPQGWMAAAQQQQQQLMFQQQQQQQQLQQLQQQLLQQQMQQQQRQARAQAFTVGSLPGFAGMASSEPVAVPMQRHQQQPQQQIAASMLRSMSGVSCLSPSGTGDGQQQQQQLASGRSSNGLMLQSSLLEQQLAAAGGGATALSLAAFPGGLSAAVSWQLHQQQHQQQQQATQLQMLQRALAEDLPRTAPISIGAGVGSGATAAAAAALAARRDTGLRAGHSLSSDPTAAVGAGGLRGVTLASSLPAPAPVMGSTPFGHLAGLSMDAPCIAAAAGAASLPTNVSHPLALLPGVVATAGAAAMPTQGMMMQLPGTTRPLDVISSSAFTAPAAYGGLAGSGGSSSLSPPNCNTLAGALSEQGSAFAQMAGVIGGGGNGSRQLLSGSGAMVLPGSAPPALGLAGTLSMASRGGSCDLSDAHVMRMSSDGYDPLLGPGAGGSASSGGIGFPGGLGDFSGANLKELDAERLTKLNRQKRMLRMRATATDGTKKVRAECRKQLGAAADARHRPRGRFAKVNSSDALTEYAALGSQPRPTTSGSGNASSLAAGSVCTAPAGITAFHNASGGGSGWGMHAAGAPQHMQRIDEEGANEGQSAFMTAAQQQSPDITAGGGGSTPGLLPESSPMALNSATGGQQQQPMLSSQGRSGSDYSTLHHQQQQQQQQIFLRRVQSSSVLEASRAFATGGSAPAPGGLASCGSVGAVPSTLDLTAGGGTQDCVITEHDLTALGFDDLLPQFSSGGFSNAACTDEDMDESAESMSEAVGGMHRPPSRARHHPKVTQTQHPSPPQPQLPQQQHTSAPVPAAPNQTASAPQQHPQQQSTQHHHHQQGTQPRLSVLDRPIMYGTDRSQFSPAQLSLLDAILADQYRPGSSGSR